MDKIIAKQISDILKAYSDGKIIKTITKNGFDYQINNDEIKPNDYIVIFGHYMGGNHITKVREITEKGIVVIEGGIHSFRVCRKIVRTNNPDIEE